MSTNEAVLAPHDFTSITVGQGWKMTIDSFYDFIKQSVGNWSDNLLFQINLITETIDISPKYEAWSIENLRSNFNHTITKNPVNDNSIIEAPKLSTVYFDFITALKKYVKHRF